jgi:long-chain acyl-CoA synthetase
LAEHPLVRSLIETAADAVNAGMPQVQHVRKFCLFTKELDHDHSEVTPP